MNDWKRVRLSDVCQINKNTYSVSEKWEFINYLDTGNLTRNQIQQFQYIKTEKDKLPSRARRKVAYDDILYSTVRPNQCHYGIIKDIAPNMLVSTGFAVISVDKSKADSNFIYYYLIQNEIVETLHAIGEQSTSAYPSIKPSDIANLELPLPSLEIQKEISGVLRSLDNKIENNKKINHHLEQMGQELFEQVYYNGSPAQLGDVISTLESGSRPKGGAEVGGIPSIGAENIERFGQYDYTKEKFISLEYFKKLNRGVVHSGDVLLYKDGAYTGKVSMALDNFPHAQCAINEHIFILRPNKLAPSSFFLYFLLLYDENRKALFSRASSKAAQPGLNQTEVKTLSILLPTTEEIAKFNTTIAPIMHQIAKNANENRKLSMLRDTLLPKLLSGEISVNQAAK
ncbi:restriction endonuclease subunit S [Streptococcus dentiloxodontae]